MTFDLCTGAIHVSWTAAESSAVWRHTTTTSSQVQLISRRHRDVTATWRCHGVTDVIVTSLRRDGVMTSLTDCRRHRDVTAACQRLWRRYDVSTWRLREPHSTWSVSSIARLSTQCNKFPDLILHNAPLWRHHNNERDVNNDACPECSLQLIIIIY